MPYCQAPLLVHKVTLISKQPLPTQPTITQLTTPSHVPKPLPALRTGVYRDLGGSQGAAVPDRGPVLGQTGDIPVLLSNRPDLTFEP